MGLTTGATVTLKTRPGDDDVEEDLDDVIDIFIFIDKEIVLAHNHVTWKQGAGHHHYFE